MAVIDPKKLLPESSKRTSILVPKSNVQVASPSMSTKMLQPADKPAAGGGSIVVVEKLIKINDILKDTLKIKKDREKAEDKQEEKEERQQREQNLEKQKASKKKGKSLFQIPKSGGLDWLGNWLTWTVVGFLFNNLKEFLAYLKPIWTNVIVPVGKIVFDIGKALLNGFVSFVEIGYGAYKTIEGLIGDLGGEGAEEEFAEASKGLTTLMNAAIITLMIAASTKPGGGGVNPKNKNRPGRPGTPGNRGRNTGVTRGRGGSRPGSGGIFRRRPNVTQGGGGPRLLDRFTRRGASKVTTGLGGRLTGKLGLRAAGRVLKPVLGRLPIVGGLIEFFISWALGDPIGKAAFRGVGSTLLGALGGIIGSVIPGPGTLIGAALGGIAGGEIAGRLYDMIFGNEQPKKPKKPKKDEKPDKKKPVSKSQQRRKNRRSRGISRVERKVAVGKVDKTETRPGQDLLNKAMIEKFYGKTHTSGDNTPYDFLVNASGIAKNNKALNGVIGSLMGSGIDLTLGQKPDQRSINQISDTLSAFAAASMQKDLNKAVLEIQEMFALEDGGSVPASRAISRKGDDALTRMRENLQRGISDAINITSLEITAKLANTIKYGGLSSDKDKDKDGDKTPKNINTGGGYASSNLTGAAKSRIGNDTEFLKEIKRVSKKFGIREGDLLGLMASESGLNPAESNGTHVGLIQFSKDSAAAVGTTQSALVGMTRAQQMKYVEKYFQYWKDAGYFPDNPTAGQLYAVVFAPAYSGRGVDEALYSKGSAAYAHNAPLDVNNDGKITIGEMAGRIEKKKKEFGISDILELNENPNVDSRVGYVGEIMNAVAYAEFSDPTGSSLVGVSGYNNMYRTAKRPNHMGIDIGTSGNKGYFVGLKLNGKVTVNQTQSGKGGGHFVAIESGGKEYFFMHLARKSHLKIGQKYTSGQIIGEIGNSGARDIHLHYEVRVNNRHINPKPYLNLLIIGKKNPNPTVQSPEKQEPPSQSPQPPQSSGPTKFTRSSINSFFAAKEGFRKFQHEGIDIEAKQGTKISFSVGGTIIASYPSNSTSKDSNGGYGAFVDLKLDNGKIIRMSHLSKIYSWVRSGAKFGANEVVALSGGKPGSPGAGRSGGPHIHFEQHEMSGLGIEETMENKVDPLKAGAFNYIQQGGTLRQNISSLQVTPGYQEQPPVLLYQKELVLVG